MTQQQALDILKLGHNVFLTGPAGSGKTYVLNQYITFLKENKISVGITASTGIAATHMGGVTIHSWVGMGIRVDMDEKDIAELLKRHYLRNRFIQTKVLIIDEISMLHSYRLDLIDKICRKFKGNDVPFGGMQVVMCGDFFQLPPITTNSNIESRNSKQIQNTNDKNITHFENSHFEPSKIVSNFRFCDSNLQSDYAYHSAIWNEMQLQVCYLDEQHRQDDRAFSRVLNDIRNSEVNEMTVEYLSERLNQPVKGYSKPTRLFTHNTDVDAINKTQLEALPGETHEYHMTWRGSLGLTESLRKSCLAPETLQLKIGAQVMFVKNNYELGYVNGTLGEVISFDKDGLPIVRTFSGSEIVVTLASWEIKEDPPSHEASEGQVKAAIAQLPLRLAWAITVHKSQGMSLDSAEVDLSRSFIPGMGYVALSRVRSLNGLKLMGMNQMSLQVNQDVVEMDKDFVAASHEVVVELHAMGVEQKQQRQKDFLTYLQEK